MAYQSEAQLEEQLIEQLKTQNYNVVSLPDYDALLANFKAQFEAFNSVNLKVNHFLRKNGNAFLITLTARVFLKAQKY